MSKFLTNAAVIEFDSEVKHAYQGMGKLRQTVSTRTGVTGESVKFTRMGRGFANQKASQADVTPMDITYERPLAILENWTAPEYTDIFDLQEVNFDEKQELAYSIARALTRREDQIILDALGDVSYSATPADDDTGATIAAGGTGLTVAKLIAAAAFLNDRAVPMQDRHIIHSANDLVTLLGETEVTSSDFNTVKALVQGEINTFMGFQFHIIESRVEGGLPDNTAYAYHKSAIGYAVGLDMKTTVDWVAHKTSWLCNGMLKAGAVARDSAGIVEILTA